MRGNEEWTSRGSDAKRGEGNQCKLVVMSGGDSRERLYEE